MREWATIASVGVALTGPTKVFVFAQLSAATDTASASEEIARLDVALALDSGADPLLSARTQLSSVRWTPAFVFAVVGVEAGTHTFRLNVSSAKETTSEVRSPSITAIPIPPTATVVTTQGVANATWVAQYGAQYERFLSQTLAVDASSMLATIVAHASVFMHCTSLDVVGTGQARSVGVPVSGGVGRPAGPGQGASIEWALFVDGQRRIDVARAIIEAPGWASLSLTASIHLEAGEHTVEVRRNFALPSEDSSCSAVVERPELLLIASSR